MEKENAKKYKSKWFVVAQEGATTDGRNIARAWIEQMAESYNPKTYGARINIDHIKFWAYRKDEPHSQCYGDVIALKTAETEDGKLQLLAQIDPTDALIELNKNRQKVYTSIEVDPNFSDSGKAYLVGLAVTDNPASLGTEMLQFAASAQANPFTARKQKAENLFTASVETVLEFEEQQTEPKESIFSKVAALLGRKDKQDDARFADQSSAIALLSEHVKDLGEENTALSQENAELKTKFAELESQVSAVQSKLNQLESEPKPEYRQRPLVTGESVDNGRFF
ncbi:GPO family capsid scaffolding protein [Caviibacterium pharyngocola]|uniref:Capsid scaffolding protein n=1 Tax=Caviibacterium pharyngocola TaxID=28159 RepID=A0A2M8RT95_9PAST|nr:GPO family capsid scaffolding protein [Caviibacterium pharyngocola]PJG82112.1 capsid scaffolding protein [Caviibacterium pharyngocola]